jgi:hypothetical protein
MFEKVLRREAWDMQPKRFLGVQVELGKRHAYATLDQERNKLLVMIERTRAPDGCHQCDVSRYESNVD